MKAAISSAPRRRSSTNSGEVESGAVFGSIETSMLLLTALALLRKGIPAASEDAYVEPDIVTDAGIRSRENWFH